MDEHMFRHTRVNRWIRFVLMAGMALSVITLVIGLALYALDPGASEEVDLSLGDIASGVARGDPIAVIDLGIVFLIATPLTRVVAALLVFAADREPRYIIVSLIVLALIAASILTG